MKKREYIVGLWFKILLIADIFHRNIDDNNSWKWYQREGETFFFYTSSVESQKGSINIWRCFIENQKGAILYKVP